MKDNGVALDCCRMQLMSLKGIFPKDLKNLQKLWCRFNGLKSLREIPSEVNLRELNCSFNDISSLRGISTSTNLIYLNCSSNELSSLEEISCLANLLELNCCYNHISSLKSLSTLRNLQKLYCTTNNLSSLEGILTLENLQILYCCHNRLKSYKYIPHAVIEINLHGNPVNKFYKEKDVKELSGTKKFMILKDERISLDSHVSFLSEMDFYKLYAFF